MQPEKIYLSGEKETLLLTLYCKALESRSPEPILRDETAERIVEQIDFDYRKFTISSRDQFIISVRARQLDLWVLDFIAKHPNAIILHLGCGLDSRILRVAPPASVRWFDLDYPEVIALRQQFYVPRDGYHMIGSDILNPNWIKDIPSNVPAMIVAEGVSMYLSEMDVRQLLERVTTHFSYGEVAFDVLSPAAVRHGNKRYSPVRKTGATFSWGIWDPRQLERWNPRLELVDEWFFTKAPKIAKLHWSLRLLTYLADHLPSVRRTIRLLRYRIRNFPICSAKK